MEVENTTLPGDNRAKVKLTIMSINNVGQIGSAFDDKLQKLSG